MTNNREIGRKPLQEFRNQICYHSSCRTTVSEKSLVLANFVLVNTSGRVDSVDSAMNIFPNYAFLQKLFINAFSSFYRINHLQRGGMSILSINPVGFFSSPEHNVLRGSYCDRSSSGVRPSVRPSVNNFFKNLLLQNQKANLDKTWQECSLGEALQKLLKEFNSNKNSGCHGNKMAENGKNL